MTKTLKNLGWIRPKNIASDHLQTKIAGKIESLRKRMRGKTLFLNKLKIQQFKERQKKPKKT